jgi:hypothetical protein
MHTARLNLAIYQGVTYANPLLFRAADGTTPLNLTGYTARMQVRERVESSAVLLELTTENGRITIDGPTGTVTLALTATETAAIDWAAGVYDLELVDGATVYRPLEGRVRIDPEVTR